MGFFQDQHNWANEDKASAYIEGQVAAGNLPQSYSGLPGNAALALIPQIMQNQHDLAMQGAVNAQLQGQSPQQAYQQFPQQAPQQGLAAYGSTGDANPSAPAPQTVGGQYIPPQGVASVPYSQTVSGQVSQPQSALAQIGASNPYNGLPPVYQNAFKAFDNNPALLGSKLVPEELKSAYNKFNFDPATKAQFAAQNLNPNNLSGDDFLATLPPSEAAKVQAVHDGRLPYPTGQSLRSPQSLQLQQEVLAAYPDEDATTYKARQKTINDFSPGGTVGKQLVAAETAIGHLGAAADASSALGGYNAGFASPLVNGVSNFFKNQNPNLIAYNRFAKQGADEVAAYTGANTIPGMASQEKLLAANNSPDARQAALVNAVQTMYAKIEPQVEQYNRVMGTNKTVSDFFTLPETQKALAKIGFNPSGDQQQALAQYGQPQVASITPEQAAAELARRRAR